MSLLFESIQIFDGQPQRLDYHNDRLNRSRNQLICSHADIYLEDFINIPDKFSQGKVKCRIDYGQDVNKIEFVHYQEKRFLGFKMIDISFNYDFKYGNRSDFDELKKGVQKSIEFILVKDGFISDTTFSNIIFKNKNGQWFTPHRPLLEGIQREFLLDEGIIKEAEIKPIDLKKYTHFMLINAMLDFDLQRVYDIGLVKR